MYVHSAVHPLPLYSKFCIVPIPGNRIFKNAKIRRSRCSDNEVRMSVGISVPRTTFEICDNSRYTETRYAEFTVCKLWVGRFIHTYPNLRVTRFLISRVFGYLERSPRYGFTNWQSDLVWISAKMYFNITSVFSSPQGFDLRGVRSALRDCAGITPPSYRWTTCIIYSRPLDGYTAVKRFV